MFNRLIIITVICLLSALSVHAASFTGRVVKVADGDTLTVLTADSQQHKIRLAEIDTPETGHGSKKPGQPFGQVAKKYASDLAAGKQVRVDVVDKDRYGRIVGRVILPGGSSLNARMVGAGLAWVYRQYAKDPELYRLEEDARTAQIGLWSDPTPVPPWVHRKEVWGR